MATTGSALEGCERVLDEEGRVREGATVPDLGDDELVGIYRDMYLARRFDRRCVSLTRRGEVSSFPPLYGQEAAQVASARALDGEGWIAPTYRDYGACMARGVDPARVLWYFDGVADGSAADAERGVLPINGSVGSQVPHTTGVAWASLLDGDPAPALCYFGDGATSQGDFHEALNFAGVFDAPAVFFCQNNGWAISLPRERQTASDTIAVKAEAYGFEGVRVDGTDPLAVHRVTREAAAAAVDPPDGRARPTLVEAVCYRLGPHSTADDPSVYRDGVPGAWEGRDPVERYERFLRATGRLDAEALDALQETVEAELDEAIDRALAADPGGPDGVFEHVHAERTPRQRAQNDWIRRFADRHGEDALRHD